MIWQLIRPGAPFNWALVRNQLAMDDAMALPTVGSFHVDIAIPFVKIVRYMEFAFCDTDYRADFEVRLDYSATTVYNRSRKILLSNQGRRY